MTRYECPKCGARTEVLGSYVPECNCDGKSLHSVLMKPTELAPRRQRSESTTNAPRRGRKKVSA